MAPPLSPKASAGDTNGGASGSGVRKGKQRRPPRGNMSQGSLMPGDVGRSKEVMEYGVGQSARAAIYGATASPDGGRRSKQSTDIGGGRRPRPSTDRGGGRRPRQSTDHGGGRWPRQSTDGAFVPPMRIEVNPPSLTAEWMASLLATPKPGSRAANKRNFGRTVSFEIKESDKGRSTLSAAAGTTTTSKLQSSRLSTQSMKRRLPSRFINTGEREKKHAQRNAKHINVPGPGKFPVFFVGGTVTVRGWASGEENTVEMRYLCLKAFECLDDEIEMELIEDDEDPQFLEWPSANELSMRIGAKPGGEIEALAPGSILEVRSSEWLRSIRSARERAMLERALAPMSRVQRAMRSVYLFMTEPSSGQGAKMFAFFMMTIILISTLTFCLETTPPYYRHESEVSVWFFIEAACIAIFTLELGIRLLVCPNKLKFVSEWMNLIDFLAVLPFYLEMLAFGITVPGLSVLRVLRLARVLRLMKVSQGPVRILGLTLRESLKPMYSLLLLIGLAMLVFASFIYFAERGSFNRITGVWERQTGLRCPITCTDAVLAKSWTEPHTYGPCQPSANGTQVSVAFLPNHMVFNPRLEGVVDGASCRPVMEPSPFHSIPISCWWALVTMTTLGYGDMVPASPLGKLLAVCCMVCGTMVIALPVTVIGQNFSTVYEHTVQQQKRAAEIQKRRRELEKMAKAATSNVEDEYRARTFHALASNSMKQKALSAAHSTGPSDAASMRSRATSSKTEVAPEPRTGSGSVRASETATRALNTERVMS